MKTFKDKRILITGASSGIGRALAQALAAEGAKLALVARRGPLMKGLGGLVIQADLSKEKAARAAAKAAIKKLGGLDLLINNAGVLEKGEVGKLAMRSWRNQMEVNFFAPLAITQECLPALRASKGALLNVSSPLGKISVPRIGPYCASKHALEALSDALRLEERRHGVSVTTLRPDLTETAMASQSRNSHVHTAAQVARIALAGLRSKKPYVNCTFRGRLLKLAKAFLPETTDFAMLQLESRGRLH